MAGQVSRRVRHVWGRNLHVFLRTWKVSFLPPIFDSLFFLLALGYGLGQFVAEIDGVEYARFVAPAIVAIGIMNASYFETTYGSFVRMYYQKTFDALIATPVTIEEVIVGEILWGATKAVIYTALVLPILVLFGVVSLPSSLLLAAARPPRRSPLRRDRALLHGLDPVDRHPQLPVVPLHHADDGPLGHLLPAREPAAPGPVRRVRDPAAHARRLARPCPDPAGRRAASPSSVSSGWLVATALTMLLAIRMMRKRLVI